MNPESLVPSRETCERLKAAGFPQDTLLQWSFAPGGFPHVLSTQDASFAHPDYCAAPTLVEILKQLRKDWNRADVETWDSEKGPQCCVSVDDLARTVEVRGSNPAEAAAQLWLKVKEGA